jgi:hypothetical protein
LISRSVALKASTPNFFQGCLETHRLTARRLTAPWSVKDIGAAFVVKDGNGQQLAYVYFEEEPQRRTSGKMLTKDEARRIAADIAKLGCCRSLE